MSDDLIRILQFTGEYIAKSDVISIKQTKRPLTLEAFGPYRFHWISVLFDFKRLI